MQVALDNLVLASVYVPNGGKDYAAKLRFLQSLVAWARALHAQGRELVLCGDINIARTDIDVHPRERKPGIIGQRDEERALFEALLGDHLIDVTRALDPDNTALFTLVAALARHAQAQHRLADRLHPRLARDRRARNGVQSPGRCRHQRSCAGHDDGADLKRHEESWIAAGRSKPFVRSAICRSDFPCSDTLSAVPT